MADSLNMNGLSINEQPHHGGPHHGGRGGRAYIPPHLRGSSNRGPPPPINQFDGADPTPAGAAAQGLNGSAWANK